MAAAALNSQHEGLKRKVKSCLQTRPGAFLSFLKGWDVSLGFLQVAFIARLRQAVGWQRVSLGSHELHRQFLSLKEASASH